MFILFEEKKQRRFNKFMDQRVLSLQIICCDLATFSKHKNYLSLLSHLFPIELVHIKI